MNPVLGRFLIYAGVVLILVGAIIVFNVHVPWLGRLPGDISIKRENFTFYFPLTSSLVISALLSLIFYLMRRK
jgi:hypothetical protein